MRADPESVERMMERLARRLLECRAPGGHWEGELSSSALSTATASAALALVERGEAGRAGPGSMSGVPARLAGDGLRWLALHQNPDGGFGDTVQSPSNISTTALAWAAFSLAGGGGESGERAFRAAGSWLEHAAGGIDPPVLAEAIARRYGKDRTFSVPILTVLALAGRLGPAGEAWRLVPQLPFELAACPQRWFRWLRLPVVSYAILALTREPAWLVVAAALGGVGLANGAAGALTVSSFDALLAERTSETERTRVFASAQALWNLALATGAAFAGLPELLRGAGLDPIGSYRPMFLGAIAVTIVATALVLPVKDLHAHREQRRAHWLPRRSLQRSN